MVCYSCHLKNFPYFVVIYTVKGFSVVNETEVWCVNCILIKLLLKNFNMGRERKTVRENDKGENPEVG